MPPHETSPRAPTKLQAFVEAERLFLPHLLARLAQVGVLDRIVVFEPRRSFAARVAATRRALMCFGLCTSVRITLANATARIADRICRDRFYSVNKVARVFGIPVVSVHSMDAEDTVRLLGSAGSGVVFAQVSRLVPPRLLRCAEFWNKHCAPLPSYGGVLPVLWAMSRGERRLGVTIHRMNERFDEGPVLSQAEIDAAGRTFFDAYHDLYDLGADLLIELARDGRRRTITQGLPRSYFGWPDAAIRREFRLRGRFGRAFRLHPRVPPQRATTRC